jgi:hypothetical protein
MGVPCLSFRRTVKITEGLAAGESPSAVSECGSEQERLRVMERGHAPYPLMVARPTCQLRAEALASLGLATGWMHDTLSYISRDPVHRAHHHDELTFSLIYAFSQNFVLPPSHYEVVMGRALCWPRCPVTGGRKFANLRAYMAFMWTHPGKRLTSSTASLGASNGSMHRMQARTCSPISVVVACNFTPKVRHGVRLGIPRGGRRIERLNTDSSCLWWVECWKSRGRRGRKSPRMGTLSRSSSTRRRWRRSYLNTGN